MPTNAPTPNSGSEWTILCDFDGTIAVEDVIDSLLDCYGRPGWEALEQDWRAGRIGSRECMSGQVALLDMSREELDAHLAGLWIDHAFPGFVARARALGVPIRVVSDGLDYAIHTILGRYGLDDLPLAANHLSPATPPQRWQLASPFQAEGCASGTCKCACVERARADGATRTLLIGDGASDFCAADRVDFVFAKHRLIEHCRAAGIPYVPITGFEDALDFLPRLLDGSLLEAEQARPADSGIVEEPSSPRHSGGSQQPNGWSSRNPASSYLNAAESLDPGFRRDGEPAVGLFKVSPASL